MKYNPRATLGDKTGYLRNIIFFHESKATCFVLSFTHHAFPLKDVYVQRGPCVSHLRWKGSSGWLFCLRARRSFRGPYPSAVFVKTCSLFNFSSRFGHTRCTYNLATSVNTQTAVMTLGRAGFVFGDRALGPASSHPPCDNAHVRTPYRISALTAPRWKARSKSPLPSGSLKCLVWQEL